MNQALKAELLEQSVTIESLIESNSQRLIQIRRHLHQHPELSHEEYETTSFIASLLTELGLEPVLMKRTGLHCDIAGSDPSLKPLAIRADMDALGIEDLKKVSYRSKVAGVSHSCGHDVHMTSVIGAAMALIKLQEQGKLKRTVRLLFQPSEEMHPCGALEMIEAGIIDGLDSIYTLHCDPSFEVGHIGLKAGPITSATDPVRIEVRGAGGHTSRPHNTQDLIYAMGKIATDLPAALTRRMDPRSGVNLTWGSIHAGSTFNAIPASGVLEGSLRCLDKDAWSTSEELLEELSTQIALPYGVEVRVQHDRGVPPVSNSVLGVKIMESAAKLAVGEHSVDPARQSLGGEDFAWYLEKSPGALARLGTRTPGGRIYDLHMGDLLIDERAIAIGAKFLATLCVVRDSSAAN